MTADTQLDTLEARGLIRPAALQPELEYLFRHALVQDAAYGSLLKQERRELHRLVGETIEALYSDRGAELAGILAFHFEQAGDAQKALRYLIADGRYALERNALQEAGSAYQRAAALLPPPDESETSDALRQRVEVTLGWARAVFTFLTPEEVIDKLETVVDEAERLGDLELLAQLHLHIALIDLESGHKAVNARVQRSLRRIEEIGLELDDPSLGALPLALVGLNKVFVGPIREGVESLEKAIPRMEGRRDFIGAAFARGWLAIGYAMLGEFDKAAVAERNAVDEAAKGDVIAQLDAQITQAMIASLRGELDDALPIAKACVERSQLTGATACTVVSAWVLGDIYQRRGEYTEAAEVLQLGYDMSPVAGNATSVWRPTLQAWLGTAQTVLGVSDADDIRWQETLDAARAIANKPGEAGILAKRAEVRARSGNLEGAITDYAASAAILEQEGARPTLARVLRDQGLALRQSGRKQDGDGALGRALELFREVGLGREASEVEAELG